MRLQRIRERHPDEITPDQHPAEILVFHIPGCENGLFVPEIVSYIEELEGKHQADGCGQRAESLILLGGEGVIDGHPADQAWPAFEEKLDVKLSQSRVKSDAHEIVVNEVARGLVTRLAKAIKQQA